MGLYEPQGRWRVWKNGVLTQHFPRWVSYRVQIPRSSVGGFELVLSLDEPGTKVLLEDPFTFLSFEVMDTDGVWWEPPQARFIPVTRRINYAQSTATLSGATYGWLLGKAVRWYQPGDENEEGKKVFVNASAGTILQWHYYWMMVRRAVQNLTMDFDGFLDSSANAWTGRFDVEYEWGTPLRDIFDGFQTDEILWRTNGSTLQVSQERFADEPTDSPVLWAGVDVEIDAIEVSLDSTAGAVMALGQDKKVGIAGLPVVGPLGRWEVSVSQSGTTSDSTLITLAGRELTKRGLTRSGATVTLLPSSKFIPFETIKPGQTVTIRLYSTDERAFRWGVSHWEGPDGWGSGGTWSQEISDMIDEIVISDDGSRASVSLTVGSMSMQPLEIMTRTVAGVTGGRVTRRSLTGVGR